MKRRSFFVLGIVLSILLVTDCSTPKATTTPSKSLTALDVLHKALETDAKVKGAYTRSTVIDTQIVPSLTTTGYRIIASIATESKAEGEIIINPTFEGHAIDEDHSSVVGWPLGHMEKKAQILAQTTKSEMWVKDGISYLKESDHITKKSTTPPKRILSLINGILERNSTDGVSMIHENGTYKLDFTESFLDNWSQVYGNEFYERHSDVSTFEGTVEATIENPNQTGTFQINMGQKKVTQHMTIWIDDKTFRFLKSEDKIRIEIPTNIQPMVFEHDRVDEEPQEFTGSITVPEDILNSAK